MPQPTLEESEIRRLAHAHLNHQEATLYCLVIFGDRNKSIAPAAFRRKDKLTWNEQLIFGKVIGRRTGVVAMLWMMADALMRGVLSDAQRQMPVLTVTETPMYSATSCNLALQSGHDVLISYDSTQGKALGIPNFCAREKII